MLFALAISIIEKILSVIISVVEKPLFPAISFIPARIITTVGFNAMTSALKRISICGVVCPLIPRLTYFLSAKKLGSTVLQNSVIESPKKITR